MVEKLLEFLVGEIDTELFESVKTENFETSDIETTNEERSLEVCGECFIDIHSYPFK
jgi:hypothetical protein